MYKKYHLYVYLQMMRIHAVRRQACWSEVRGAVSLFQLKIGAKTRIKRRKERRFCRFD